MQAGDRVAMLSLNSDRYLEYQMAVPWGGGVLNPCNIRWSAAEILYSLDDSGSTILLVDETFRPLVEQFRRDSRTLREVIYCGDAAVPAGMHGYEALIAEADAGGRRRAPRRRPRRHLLHRRHHRLSEGRDAEPHQPVQRGPGDACRGPGSHRRHLPARRADVPPGRHGLRDGAVAGRQHAFDRSGVQPRGWCSTSLERDRVTPPAAGADDDPDAGRSPGDEEAARPERAED